MQKYIKTGLLILLLVVPVFIFLFLKGFTTNHFDLPYYVPLRDASTHDVLRNHGDTVFYKIPEASLRSIQNLVTPPVQLGRMTIVVNAFQLPCGDTCRQVMDQLSRVAKLHDPYPELRILSLVNVKNSRLPDQIKEYVEKKPGWRLLPIPDSTFTHFLNSVFRFEENVPGLKTISSNKKLILIDKSGYIRGYYNAQYPEELDRLLVEIKVLEYNRKEKK